MGQKNSTVLPDGRKCDLKVLIYGFDNEPIPMGTNKLIDMLKNGTITLPVGWCTKQNDADNFALVMPWLAGGRNPARRFLQRLGTTDALIFMVNRSSSQDNLDCMGIVIQRMMRYSVMKNALLIILADEGTASETEVERTLDLDEIKEGIRFSDLQSEYKAHLFGFNSTTGEGFDQVISCIKKELMPPTTDGKMADVSLETLTSSVIQQAQIDVPVKESVIAQSA